MARGREMKKTAHEAVSRLPEAAVLVFSAVIALTIAFLSYTNAQQVAEAGDQLRIAQEVRSLSADLLSNLKDAETGQRGFLVTGEDQYLEPYNQALSEVPRIVRRLEAVVAKWPDEAQGLGAIQPLISSKLSELQQTIALRRAHRDAEALAIVRRGRGKAIMDEIRQRLGAITEVAQGRSNRLSEAAGQSTGRLRLASTGGSLILLGFLAVLAITVSRSTTLREQLYVQARAREKLWATTVSSIADAVILTDASGKITFINSVAQQLSGWDETEALGRSVSDVLVLVNEETRARVDNPVEQALQTGVAVGLTNHTTLIGKKGGEISIDDSAAPIRDEDGKIVGAVLIFRDITAKRLSDRKVAETAVALRRANEELQQFAYMASHDLRSPLNSVSSMAQILAQRLGNQLGKEGQELIDYITGGVARMNRLIDDILSFANASEVNREPAYPVPVDQMLERALENLASEIRESGASIKSDPLPWVLAHETPVLQMLQNLVGNALKYSSDDPPQIFISSAEQGSECVISVRDNGIGIEHQYAEEIFQPFRRLHGQEYPGSGIGLASCKKIATAYGGRIWVESEPGKGSTFFFTLPRAERDSAAIAKNA
jgi:PAS domain S-box-containing protein